MLQFWVTKQVIFGTQVNPLNTQANINNDDNPEKIIQAGTAMYPPEYRCSTGRIDFHRRHTTGPPAEWLRAAVNH